MNRYQIEENHRNGKLPDRYYYQMVNDKPISVIYNEQIKKLKDSVYSYQMENNKQFLFKFKVFGIKLFDRIFQTHYIEEMARQLAVEYLLQHTRDIEQEIERRVNEIIERLNK